MAGGRASREPGFSSTRFTRGMLVQWRRPGSGWRYGQIADEPDHMDPKVWVFSHVETRDACKGERVAVAWGDIRVVPKI